MIFLLLLQVFASSTIDLSKEALFKFPALHFDHKKSTGEWVVTNVLGKPAVTQVSKSSTSLDNTLSLPAAAWQVDVDVTVLAGVVKNRLSGLVAITNKRKIHCIFESTNEETKLKDSLNSTFQNSENRSLRSDIPVRLSFKQKEKEFICTLGKVELPIQVLSGEVIEDVQLYTSPQTIAAFSWTL